MKHFFVRTSKFWVEVGCF